MIFVKLFGGTPTNREYISSILLQLWSSIFFYIKKELSVKPSSFLQK